MIQLLFSPDQWTQMFNKHETFKTELNNLDIKNQDPQDELGQKYTQTWFELSPFSKNQELLRLQWKVVLSSVKYQTKNNTKQFENTPRMAGR